MMSWVVWVGVGGAGEGERVMTAMIMVPGSDICEAGAVDVGVDVDVDNDVDNDVELELRA
jgi:hypothetical protein